MFKPEKIAQKKRDCEVSLFPVFTGLSSGRGGRIRTYDLLLPKQARYRATLHPEGASFIDLPALRRDAIPVGVYSAFQRNYTPKVFSEIKLT